MSYETRAALRELSNQYGYVSDPHGAVAYAGLKQYREKCKTGADICGIFLETAHPAKFQEIVEPIIGKKSPCLVL